MGRHAVQHPVETASVFDSRRCRSKRRALPPLFGMAEEVYLLTARQLNEPYWQNTLAWPSRSLASTPSPDHLYKQTTQPFKDIKTAPPKSSKPSQNIQPPPQYPHKSPKLPLYMPHSLPLVLPLTSHHQLNSTALPTTSLLRRRRHSRRNSPIRNLRRLDLLGRGIIRHVDDDAGVSTPGREHSGAFLAIALASALGTQCIAVLHHAGVGRTTSPTSASIQSFNQTQAHHQVQDEDQDQSQKQDPKTRNSPP